MKVSYVIENKDGSTWTGHDWDEAGNLNYAARWSTVAGAAAALARIAFGMMSAEQMPLRIRRWVPVQKRRK